MGKTFNRLAIIILVFIGAGSMVCGQSFINLNFENVRVPLPPQGSGGLSSEAFPGWDNSSGDYVGYNSLTLGGAGVFLADTNAARWGTPMPIDGRFSVYLMSGFMGSSQSAWVAQTGLVPSSVRSLMFYSTSPGLIVSFAGQPLPNAVAYSGPLYSAYIADISAFAGQTGELRFTMPSPARGVLDNISFWTSPVPEPGLASFALLGCLLIGRRLFARRKCSSGFNPCHH